MLSAACTHPPVRKVLKEDLQPKFVIGSEHSTVTAVLDSLQIEHSAYEPDEHRIDAIVRNTAYTFPISTSLSIILTFDDDGRLERSEFKDVYTGP